MNSDDEVKALLTEIRDLQREQLEEFRVQVARTSQLADDAMERQKVVLKATGKLVVLAAILILALVGYAAWRIS